MPIAIPTELTCDHCGKTATCKMVCSFAWKTMEKAGRSYEEPGLAIRGIPTWFWRDDAVACSEACKAVLSNEPRFTGYSGKWSSCG
jgi:hypothetical protein